MKKPKIVKKTSINLTTTTLFLNSLAQKVINHFCGENHVYIHFINIDTERVVMGLGGLSQQSKVAIQSRAEVGTKLSQIIHFQLSFDVEDVGIWVLTSVIKVKVVGVHVQEAVTLAEKSYKGPLGYADDPNSSIHDYRMIVERLAHL